MDDKNYFRKCHGSWVGKVTGSNFGMPFEGKNPRAIKENYGQIVGWQRAHAIQGKVINDDEQFELIALMCLEKDGYDNFTVENLAKYWAYHLSSDYIFTAEKKVLENWEHNIPYGKASLPEHNPWWDFIGAQMKGELFGQLSPGDMKQAVKLARIDGNVAHHGIGVDGETFIAAMVAQAMGCEESPTRELLEEHAQNALSCCDDQGSYVALMHKIIGWYEEHPAPHEWRKSFEKLESWWRDEKLEKMIEMEESSPTHPDRLSILMRCAIAPWSVCHVLPNAGIIMVALLYGGGDFATSLELATMMGYDADCNAGNVGGILGAYYGDDLIPHYWKDFSNDIIKTAIKGWDDSSLSHIAKRVQKLAKY